MENIKVDTIEGVKEEIVYNIYDFPYVKYRKAKLASKRFKTYYNIPATFDIETTTIDGDKNSKGEYIKNPYGFMYHWQFCLGTDVVFGRTWEEFQYFYRRLKGAMNLGKHRILCVYVHNLSFEFHFMQDFIKITSLFAKDQRKPMKFETYGFEFRCSYFLSNMSLQKFCENSKLCKHYKLSGDDFDYSKIRTPKTPLTEKEKAYCYNDVRGLAECIQTMLLDDTIATIPLTNTGYVRREFRKVMSNQKNRELFEKISLTPKQYDLLKRTFRGGNTHANRYYVGQTIDNVYSFDIGSSYPTEINTGLFPM